MTGTWLSLAEPSDSIGLLMISSYMIVMLFSMLEPSSKDVWTNRFHSTWSNANFQTKVTFAGFQLSSDGYQVDTST